MSSVARFFVGVDLHKTVIQICVLDQQGQIVEERRYHAGDLVAGLKVIGSLMKYKEHGRIAVEAIGVNRWFVNSLLWGRLSRHTSPARRVLPVWQVASVFNDLTGCSSRSWFSLPGLPLASRITSQPFCSPLEGGNHPSIGDSMAHRFVRLTRGA